MYRTVKIKNVEHRAEILKEIQATKIRACAILENSIRKAEDTRTDYDHVAYESQVSGYDILGNRDIPHITIETISCAWDRSTGMSGIGYLPSALLPYALETVYRRVRTLAIEQAKDDAKVEFLATVNHGQALYRRVGSKFVRI